MTRTYDRRKSCLLIFVIGCLVQGCGLLMDAAQMLKPVVPDLSTELDVICRHRRLQVGIAVEPFPPFIFQAVRTDQGYLITGLEIELVQELTKAMSTHCGGPSLTAVPHLVHFRDLFILLTEGHLDFFISSVSYNVSHLTAASLGYSTPYYYDAGIGGVTRRPEVVAHVRHALGQRATDSAMRKEALNGLTVAVQEGRSPHIYVEANLKNVHLVVCDTLSAAFESTDPPIDVILGKQPILDFIIKRERPDWQSLVMDNGQLFLLSRELFTVVMAEHNVLLQELVNNVLFDLEQSGRMKAMYRRWFDEDYSYTQRAMNEGLLTMASQSVAGDGPGRCRRVR